MKLEDVLLVLTEQVPPRRRGRNVPPPADEPEDQGNLELPDDGDEQPQAQPEPEPEQPQAPQPEPEEPEQEVQPEMPEPEPNVPRTAPTEEDREIHRETIKKKVNAITLLKQRWQEQATAAGQEITEADMNDAIDFFNTKKNGLRPLSVPPRNTDNPQLFALYHRFPQFPAADLARIKDIQTYTWQQISFFRERYVEAPEPEEEVEQIENIQIPGATDLSRFADRARQLWVQKKRKLYDANGVMIIRIESKEQSIMYGGLQNSLRDKHKDSAYSSNYWCTTRTDSQNLYPGYRDWRAFYYVSNENVDEDHEYRVFAIGAVIPGNTNAPFTLTNLYNNSNRSSLSFDDIVNATGCQQLREVQNQIVWFPATKQESQERIFDSYTFDGKRDTDFAFLRPQAQYRFIDAFREIKSAKALMSLSAEATITIGGTSRVVDLQEEYVRRTRANNFQTRFITTLPGEDAFAMIEALRPKVKKYLHNLLIREENLPDGIYSIVAAILNKSLTKSWKDYSNPTIRLLQSKTSAGLFGVFDLENYKWVKPLQYTLRNFNYLDRSTKQKYVVKKYTSNDDYFYWLFKYEDLLIKDRTNPNYLKGKYLSGAEGDDLLARLVRY